MKPPSWTTVPSKFSREEKQTWKRWLADPNGAKPHQSIGSRSRPFSVMYSGSSVDELYEQMQRRGLVAKPKRSTAMARGRGRK